jgi:hypothetical protein
VLTVTYSFSDQGEKTLTFGDNQLSVDVQHSGPLQEYIPLLLGKDDRLNLKSGEATLTRAGKIFVIKFDAGISAETVETGLTVGARRVVTLSLRSRNSLRYRMDFSGMGG